MLDLALHLYGMNLAYAQRLTADLTDEQFTAQPVAGREMNHAAFVVGHLAWVTDYGRNLFGLEPAFPPTWKDTFGMSAKPVADRASYPSKAELLSALEAGHARFAAACAAATPEQLQAPSPENRRARFPTLGHIILHILTNHEAIHLGQLSAWRRALGLPAV